MGYTHYWYQNEIPEDKFTDLKNAVRNVIETSGIPLAGSHGEAGTSPEITNGFICFNGVGDESHETFYIERNPTPYASRGGFKAFTFCKTARKQYDPVVTAALCLANHFCKGYIEVSSDGDKEEWKEGLDLARGIVPDIGIPETVRNR